MTVFSFAFYLFAVITVTAGLMVTLSRNPVHSDRCEQAPVIRNRFHEQAEPPKLEWRIHPAW